MLKTTARTERQSYGFEVEDMLIESEYQEIPDNTYTGEFDAQTIEGKPVQIKVKKVNLKTLNITDQRIELGGYQRLIKDSDFFLDIVFYQKEEGLNVPVKRLRFDIDHLKWNQYITDEMIEMMSVKNVFDGITNSYDDDLKWTERRKSLTKDYNKKYLTIFKPLFKRDHKKQKRVQCSVSVSSLMSVCHGFELLEV